MGWITVIVIIGSLLAASIYLVLKGADRWWEYLIVAVLTVALVRPVLKTVTGDMSQWLPYGIWSDGFDGKDQIIIASAASTVLIPLVLAAGALCVVKCMIAYSRANRINKAEVSSASVSALCSQACRTDRRPPSPEPPRALARLRCVVPARPGRARAVAR